MYIFNTGCLKYITCLVNKETFTHDYNSYSKLDIPLFIQIYLLKRISQY